MPRQLRKRQVLVCLSSSLRSESIQCSSRCSSSFSLVYCKYADNVGQAFESIQRVELEETYDAVILCRSEQDLMDTALSQEIPLHKRLIHRQQVIKVCGKNQLSVASPGSVGPSPWLHTSRPADE